MTVDRCLVLAQAKGGVGKTSIATNLAGIWATEGLRVLLCDFDPQGNAALDLGYEVDNGQALFAALVAGNAVPVLRDVRPGLDVIPSGPQLTRFAMSLGGDVLAMAEALERVIREAGEYDVVVIDTPPGDIAAGGAAMLVGSHVLAPSAADDASVLGTVQLAGRFRNARQANPALKFAGVALFGIGATSRRIEASIREQMQATLGESSPVFMSRIRYASAAAVYARRHGRLATELVADAEEAHAKRFAALRSGEQAEPVPSNAAGVASDYLALADEIASVLDLQRMVA